MNDPIDSKPYPIPLRKVPRITSWEIDEMANLFYGPYKGFDGPLMKAIEYRDGDKDITLLTKDWKPIISLIKREKKKNNIGHPVDESNPNYPKWRHACLKAIPAIWYIMSNDLEEAFQMYREHAYAEAEAVAHIKGYQEYPEEPWQVEFSWDPALHDDAPLIKECPEFPLPAEPKKGAKAASIKNKSFDKDKLEQQIYARFKKDLEADPEMETMKYYLKLANEKIYKAANGKSYSSETIRKIIRKQKKIENN